MDHLAVLERLAAQKVERERQALGALDAALARQREHLAREDAAAAHECQAVAEPATAVFHARWRIASRQRRARAEREIERLEGMRGERMAMLIEGRVEVRRLELLQARARARRQAKARRLEQQEIDEVASIRAARHRTR